MQSATLTLTDQDRMTLASWTRASTVSAGHAERAAIVLACADGTGTSETARRLGVSRPTVIKWRDRFAEHGVAGLDDEPRSGRPKRVDDAAIIAAVVALLAGVLLGMPAHVSVGLLIVLPLAAAQAWQMGRVRRGGKPSWILLTGGAVALFSLTAYLTFAGFATS